MKRNPYLIKHGYFTPEKADRIKFRFAPSECCLLCHGQCPIEHLTAADLYCVGDDLYKGRPLPAEDSPDYCLGLALLLLGRKLNRPVDIYYAIRDGHIGCFDGRHRLCVAQKLNSQDKNVKISVLVNLLMD